MLSLHQLEVFYIVAESRTFGEAAEKLYISQPAISQQIKSLETGLGSKLFERSRRGISMTPAGETLLDFTREILHLVAKAENAVTNVHNLESGQTLIGATPNISSYVIPEWVRDFREMYPNLTPSVSTNVTSEIANDVLDRKLDLGIIEGEINALPTRLGRMVLEDVAQVVIVGQGHPWWGRDEINLMDFAGKSFVMRQKNSQTRAWLDTLLAQHKVEIRINGEFDNPEALKHAVTAGTCATILPEYAVRRERDLGLVHLLQVCDVELHRPLRLVWDSERIFPPVTRAFIHQLTQTYPQLEQIL